LPIISGADTHPISSISSTDQLSDISINWAYVKSLVDIIPPLTRDIKPDVNKKTQQMNRKINYTAELGAERRSSQGGLQSLFERVLHALINAVILLKMQVPPLDLIRIVNSKKMLSFLLTSLLAASAQASSACRCFPGDACWPAEDVWTKFNQSIDGRLVKTVPLGQPCHAPNYDAAECATLREGWTVPEEQ
jgi:hypothetical protein